MPSVIASSLSSGSQVLIDSRGIARFDGLTQVGLGAYGAVFMARNCDTQEVVALKRPVFSPVDPHRPDRAGIPRAVIREIAILTTLRGHGNILGFRDTIVATTQDENAPQSLYLVLDFVEHDLVGLLSFHKRKLLLPEIKCLMKQALEGLEYIHANGYVHRDIKCANMLITKQGVLKIADFGLARPFSSKASKADRLPDSTPISPLDVATKKPDPVEASAAGESVIRRIKRPAHSSFAPRADVATTDSAGISQSTSQAKQELNPPMTANMVTLWYRCPELLCGSSTYGPEVDIWSLGALIGELICARPLFAAGKEQELFELIDRAIGYTLDDLQELRDLPAYGSLVASYIPRSYSYDQGSVSSTPGAPKGEGRPEVCLSAEFEQHIAHCTRLLIRSMDESTTKGIWENAVVKQTWTLLRGMMTVDRKKRNTALKSLTEEFFTDPPHACDPLEVRIPANCFLHGPGQDKGHRGVDVGA